MSGTFEEDALALQNAFEGPPSRNKDPNIVEALAYKLRFADDGVVWHSWIDPNRPSSPPVEWPQYPKDERPSDKYDDFVSRDYGTQIPKVVDESLKRYGESLNDLTGGTCGVPLSTPAVENPDEMEEEIMNSVQLPEFPGLYPGETNRMEGDWPRPMYGDEEEELY